MEHNPEDARFLEGGTGGGDGQQAGTGQVGYDYPQADGKQLIGLEVFPYGDVDENETDAQHDAVAPVYVVETCGAQKVQKLCQVYSRGQVDVESRGSTSPGRRRTFRRASGLPLWR